MGNIPAGAREKSPLVIETDADLTSPCEAQVHVVNTAASAPAAEGKDTPAQEAR